MKKTFRNAASLFNAAYLQTSTKSFATRVSEGGGTKIKAQTFCNLLISNLFRFLPIPHPEVHPASEMPVAIFPANGAETDLPSASLSTSPSMNLIFCLFFFKRVVDPQHAILQLLLPFFRPYSRLASPHPFPPSTPFVPPYFSPALHPSYGIHFKI